MSDVREVAIGFLGCGNIGGGVWRLIQKTAGEIEKREGVRINVKKILVRDASKARDTVPMDLLTTNPDDVIDNPDIQIVAEFMGGAEPGQRSGIPRPVLPGPVGPALHLVFGLKGHVQGVILQPEGVVLTKNSKLRRRRGQQPGVPGGIMDVMDVSGNALTGRLGETGDFFKYEVLPFGFFHDRHTERVFGEFFQRSGNREEFFFSDA